MKLLKKPKNLYVPELVGSPLFTASSFGRNLVLRRIRTSKTRVDLFSGFVTKSGWNPAHILAMTKNYEIIMLWHARPNVQNIVLELPGGMPISAAEEEDHEIMLKRMLIKETGHKVGAFIQLPAERGYYDPATPDIECITGHGIDCEWVQEPVREPEEQIEVVLVPVKMLYEAAFNGEVPDFKTAAIMLYAMKALGITLTFPEHMN